MQRALIVFASSHGQTREIANKIAGRLRDRGLVVVVADAGEPAHLPAPAGFDLVIAGSRIQFGRHSSSVLAYLRQYRDALEAMPTAFFSVSMAAANKGDDPNGYLAATFDGLGWRPALTAAIAGALQYRKYNWLLRFVMRRIARAGGHSDDTSMDHFYTDWHQVYDYADRAAALIPAASQKPAEHVQALAN
jgi:menaquinone-dependent protoporphyrinogen oxidase